MESEGPDTDEADWETADRDATQKDAPEYDWSMGGRDALGRVAPAAGLVGRIAKKGPWDPSQRDGADSGAAERDAGHCDRPEWDQGALGRAARRATRLSATKNSASATGRTRA